MGLTSLGERQLDHVEVFGGDRRLEDLFCLLDHLAHVVAGGDVDEGEQLHVGLGGDGGCLPDGRVAGFRRALDLLLGEGGVVNQQVGVGGRGDGGGARRGGAGDRERAARPGRAHHPGGGDGARLPLRRLASLQGGIGRSFGHTGGRGGGGVEASRPLRLDQRVAERAAAVSRLEGTDLVAVTRDRVVL